MILVNFAAGKLEEEFYVVKMHIFYFSYCNLAAVYLPLVV